MTLPTKPRSRRSAKPAALDVEALSQRLAVAVITAVDATAVDQAQDIMYDAWEAAGATSVTLAHRALAVTPLRADAYVLLAGEATTSDVDAIALYKLGMQAGETALGAEFQELHGEFWGWLQTRPYMRARAGLAGLLVRTGHRAEALDHWRAMLALNPNDNQGVRYLLLLALLEGGIDDEVRRLLAAYDDDAGIAMTYSRALVAYGNGDPRADDLLADAVRGNAHVPAMLAGIKPAPSPTRPYLTMGGPDEAGWYVGQAMAGWRRTDGALAWLVDTVAGLTPRSRR